MAIRLGSIARSAVWVVASVALGYALGIISPVIAQKYRAVHAKWDSMMPGRWGSGFPTVDVNGQAARFHASVGVGARPLIVSLHTWSGDYNQADPLASVASSKNWNYIHPNFGGSDTTTAACLSDAAVRNISDSVEFAKRHGNVDASKIFVVGVSGGGMATLGAYLKVKEPIAAYVAWVPISDLNAWYWQSKARHNRYAIDVLACTGSKDGVLDASEAKRRSPLYWPMDNLPSSQLIIYAGINDGHSGPVPISQSILFYNRAIASLGGVSSEIDREDMAKLLTLDVPEEYSASLGPHGVIFNRSYKSVEINIFQGAHEMVPEETVRRIDSILAKN